MKKIITFIFAFIFLLTNVNFSHSGRTDSNGGHWDYSTGTYHYHNDGNSGTYKDFTVSSDNAGYVSNLEKENSNLEDKISNLQEKLDNYEYDLEEYGYNSIEEMDNKIYSLETEISNMWSGFFFFTLLVIGISHYIGTKKK